MDQLLEASSDPLWVSVVFIGALVLCHWLLIHKYPLTLKQWKLVEYMWVALALVSIFGIVQEARFYRSKITVEQSRTEALGKSMALENWLDVYSEYACDDNKGNPEYLPLCRWLKVKSSDLQLVLANEGFPADISANFLIGIEGNFVGLNEADKAVVTGLHTDYRTARQKYLTAVGASRRSSFSVLIVALAPMVFAVAVAIKFTKVSGEYLLTKP